MRAMLFAVLFALASTPVLAADKPEPKYKGKSLEYWFIRLQSAPTDAEQREAAGAIIAFGADAAPAVPELLVMLDDRSEHYREMIADVLCKLGPIAKNAVPALTKRLREKRGDPEHVIRILCAIGADAKSALPDLLPAVLEVVAKYEKTPAPRNWWIVYTRALSPELESPLLMLCIENLNRFGTDAVPILLAMIDAPGIFGKEYAAAVFSQLGTKGEEGVPALKKLLKHEKIGIRYVASVALWHVAKSNDVLPVLVDLLNPKPEASGDGHDRDVPIHAATALGEMGSAAKDALPALKALLPKPGSNVLLSTFDDRRNKAAQEAIDKIEGKSKK